MATPPSTPHRHQFLHLPLLLLVTIFITTTTAHNITDILSSHPDYTSFNNYLTQTRMADEINARQTITVLVVPNAAMDALTAGKHPLAAIKNQLSLQVLLDYYDPAKLHKINKGSVLVTTLYQTTGNAPGQLGSVNITNLRGGAVGFGSGVPGSKLDCTYTKTIKQIPYTISVLEVSAPINAPAVLAAGDESASNITGVLDKAGCKTFSALLASSGVLKVYQTQTDKGLTLFAPNDEAFKAKGVPDLSKLSNAELVSLLQYHALGSYAPKGTLKTKKDPMPTLATNGPGKYQIRFSSAGDDVSLHTGVGSSRLASTVLDATPVVIYTVDSVLLPEELFGKSPTPAPAPGPVADSPAPVGLAPEPASEAPASVMSPPAPPMESPEGAPADAPSAKSENSAADNAAVAGVKVSKVVEVVSVVVGVVALVVSL